MKNKKSLGQHWLKNRAILDEIADLAVAPSAELCLEIGPGLGTLTSSLLRRFSEVVAIEFDSDLARKLPGSFPGKNLQVINADILDIDLAPLTENRPYSVAGNIPYYITSPIIQKLINLPHRPARIVLLVQKEVAERVAAEPGRQTLISLLVQNVATATFGPVVKAAEFTPPPKVDSQVLVLTPHDPIIPAECLKLARRGFSSPRKKLSANLATLTRSREAWREILRASGLNPDARAQDLSLADWQKLYLADASAQN